jgi:hypothetical protein
MSRDARGCFITGGKPGPGRPPGSRNRLAEDFLADLCADWKKHGSAAIAKVRQQNPACYVRIAANLVPRDQPDPLPNEFDHLTEFELIDCLSEEARRYVRESLDKRREDPTQSGRLKRRP